MVQVACGQMTSGDAIPPEARLLRLVHGSDDLPEDAGGSSMEHYEVLNELRDGARMNRDWPTREGRETPPRRRRCRNTVRSLQKSHWSGSSKPGGRRGTPPREG